MTQSIVLPYLRISPVRLPRRDLVLGGGDSLLLEVSVIESDHPNARALVTTGPDAPVLTMTVSACGPSGPWDYGAAPCCTGNVLWTGEGTVSASTVGTYELRFPDDTMASWPRRCAWQIELDWNASGDTQMLSWGNLHVLPSAGTQ